MIEASEIRGLVDEARGLVRRSVFHDEQIHRAEQVRVFRRTWLLLGHESSFPDPGDFSTTSMGEDPVIVWRNQQGRLRAFLNTCPHRGATVCLYDSGNAGTVRCSYHGWTFDCDGRLVGVPQLERAYLGELDKDANGLLEVPRVESYGGLVFGSWDPNAMALDEYLGEMRWWLDVFLCFDDFGGLVALPGMQRYRTAGNWKLFCDNFVGDRYHTPTSHRSVLKLGMATPTTTQGTHGYFMAFCAPFHGLGGIYTDRAQYERDLEHANGLGSDVVDYVRERYERQRARATAAAVTPSHFSFGLVFPTFILQGIGRAFNGNLIGVVHPRGLHEIEVRQWVLVEREAPDVVKRAAARFVSRGQSGAGMIGVDDTENFERIDENLRSPMSTVGTLHYGMGIGHEDRWPGREEWKVDGLPGTIGPEYWEVAQRHFYGAWARLMERDG